MICKTGFDFAKLYFPGQYPDFTMSPYTDYISDFHSFPNRQCKQHFVPFRIQTLTSPPLYTIKVSSENLIRYILLHSKIFSLFLDIKAFSYKGDIPRDILNFRPTQEAQIASQASSH